MNGHIPFIYFSMSTIFSFKSIENKHNVHEVWGKDHVKKFCESWREHRIEIISF